MPFPILFSGNEAQNCVAFFTLAWLKGCAVAVAFSRDFAGPCVRADHVPPSQKQRVVSGSSRG